MRLIRLPWSPDAATAAAWERLRADAPTEAVFLTPEWLDAWWRHLGPNARADGRSAPPSGELGGIMYANASGGGPSPARGPGAWPLVLAALDGDAPRLIAPLHVAPIGATGVRAVRLLGGGVSDYLDFLLTPDPATRRRALATWLHGLLERGGGWDVLDLRGLPAESPTVADLLALAGMLGLPCAVLPGYGRPGIELAGTYDALLKSKPGRFRYNLRSRLKRLGALGPVRFETVSNARDVPAALEVLARLHARRWEGQHTATIFSSSERGRRFYREAATGYALRGLLDLTLLHVGERAAAGALSFVDGDTWYYYLPAWDPDLAAYAPSSLLLAHLIEAAHARGLRRFDFMLGEEPYKARWATDERRTVNLAIGNVGARGRAALAALSAWQRARDRARRSPLLQRARRYGLGRARSVLRRGGEAPVTPPGSRRPDLGS